MILDPFCSFLVHHRVSSDVF